MQKETFPRAARLYEPTHAACAALCGPEKGSHACRKLLGHFRKDHHRAPREEQEYEVTSALSSLLV